MSDIKNENTASQGPLSVGQVTPPIALASSAIEHVVILMQENRSFDHYFGMLPGVRGFYDTSSVFRQLWKQTGSFHEGTYLPGPAEYLYPFEMNIGLKMGDPGHSWLDQHTAWSNGNLTGWLASRSDESPAPTAIMGYYPPYAIPYHVALAKTFTLCDNYFCSVIGPTAPNRLALMSGTIDPTGAKPATGDPHGAPGAPSSTVYDWTSYPEQLQKAKVDCAVYEENPNDRPGTTPWSMNVAAYFKGWPDMLKANPKVSRTGASDFEDDLANKTLPTVSWIIPPYSSSEHPSYSPLAGANYLAKKISALMSSTTYWGKTAFILVYDENGGCFDHVVPPAPPAQGSSEADGEWITSGTYSGQPVGPGFRVPCIIISPWTTGGKVCSKQYDHTSILQFLGQVTGVVPENISKYRLNTFDNLMSAFDFGETAVSAASLLAQLPAAPAAATPTLDQPDPTLPQPAWPPARLTEIPLHFEEAGHPIDLPLELGSKVPLPRT